MRLTGCVLSNYFKRYIDRQLNGPARRRRWNPIAGWLENKPRKWVYNEHRPWTDAFKQYNDVAPGVSRKQIPVLPIKKWTILKGDVVEILVGKDKGKIGIVNCIIKERNWVFVEGRNCEFKTEAQHPGMPPICSKDERPLLAPHQVKLVDPSDNRGTEVEWRYTEEGESVRVSKRSGVIIPFPSDSQIVDDFVNPLTYQECEKDTTEKELTQVTFKPKVKLFEEEILESMGINDDRKRAKTYWY